MSFSSRLRQAREQANLTQQDFAKKLGVTKNAISNYENGVSSPKWDVLVKIFDVLQVEPNFLYQDDFTASSIDTALTPTQTSLLSIFDELNDEGQGKVIEYAEDLWRTGYYKKRGSHELGSKEA
jgi:transcriptional regulator with XRE-family HTH domain